MKKSYGLGLSLLGLFLLVKSWPNKKSSLIELRAIGPLSSALQIKIFEIIGYYESHLNYGAWSASENSYGVLQSNLDSKDAPLLSLVEMYISFGGKYAEQLRRYATKKDVLADLRNFKTIMTKAASDPVMRKTQVLFFTKNFLVPAYELSNQLGLLLPVSYLFCADFFINSGNKQWVRRKWAHFMKSKNQGEEKEKENLMSFLQWRSDFLKSAYSSSYPSWKKRYGKTKADEIFAYSANKRIQYLKSLLNNPYLT